jgi:hypothetical protein
LLDEVCLAHRVLPEFGCQMPEDVADCWALDGVQFDEQALRGFKRRAAK